MRTNQEIVDQLLPAAVERFIAKGRDYAGAHRNLGLAGQFSDINRKFYKMKRAMWDEEIELSDESLIEVIHDMIGHCLLTLDLLEVGDPAETGGSVPPQIQDAWELLESAATRMPSVQKARDLLEELL